ncbi:MAG: alpha/beta hydrolase-fold protein [Bacteroidota bacterium]
MAGNLSLLLKSFLALGIAATACSQNIADSIETSDRLQQLPVQTIIPTTFFSKFVSDSIRLDISLPASYNQDTTKIYPVIYLTDEYWRRDAHEIIHDMSQEKELPEVIIVGIGYPDGYDFNTIRVRDLVENADMFLTCIKDEIIPYVEKTYRAANLKRTLWGASLGGYFIIYAFTEHIKVGKLFTNYIGASVVLNPRFEHVDLLKNEQLLWETTRELPVNLYLTVGELEDRSMIKSYTQIADAIYSHDYKKLRFEYEIIPEKDHITVWKPSLLGGLRKFLND